jgi:hypothetical protein
MGLFDRRFGNFSFDKDGDLGTGFSRECYVHPFKQYVTFRGGFNFLLFKF